MAHEVMMPKMGESIAEGTVVKWLKAPGDAVQKDENLLLISTDKVEAEIPAPDNGILLDILVTEGETVAVGTVLGHVGKQGDKIVDSSPKQTPTTAQPDPAQQPQEPAPASTVSPSQQPLPAATSAAAPASTPAAAQPQQPSGHGFISPLVRRIATEHRLPEHELAAIAGTGQGGRVTKKDLLAYLQQRPQTPASQPQIPPAAAATPQPSAAVTPAVQLQFDAGKTEKQQPITPMRRAIMDNMIASKQTSAHVTTFFEIDYTAIEAIRNKHKASFRAQEGVSLTYTAFLAAAVSQCLKRHPYINARLQQDKIVFQQEIHVGIAVAIQDPEPGLLVPVIRHADRMNLRGLARSIADLAQRSRTRRIAPDELFGGTFTISNPGSHGGRIVTPIINQPQVAILGVGSIERRPKVVQTAEGEALAISTMGLLSLSFDHRLVDGVTADAFMADLKQTLETYSGEL